jgi:hypothetical protein
MNRSLCLALSLALITLLAGCSKGNLPSDLNSPDDILINSITPAAGSRIAPGSTVTFNANVSYILASASTGVITIVVEDQASVPIAGTQAQKSVASGQSSINIATPTFTVPATGVTSLQVFVSLAATGASQTSTVEEVIYTVGT